MILNNKITDFFNNINHRISRLAESIFINRQKLRLIDEKLDTILAALPNVQSINDKIIDDLK